MAPGRACAARCAVHGLERSVNAASRQRFRIEACDPFGNACDLGGEVFGVAVTPRGHGHHGDVLRLDDIGDGSYEVEWSAPFPGKYTVSVQLAAAPGATLLDAAGRRVVKRGTPRADVGGTPVLVVAAPPQERASPREPAHSPRALPRASASSPRELQPRWTSASCSPRCLSGGPTPSAPLLWDRSGEPPLAWELDAPAVELATG